MVNSGSINAERCPLSGDVLVGPTNSICRYGFGT
jgi:hypothetical protein